QARNRASWKTVKGFRWPFPKSPHDYIVHPKKLSESRVEILREPWVENELRGGRIQSQADDSDNNPIPGREDFYSIPSNGKMIFGGLEPPEYDRDCDTSLIGNRSRLPRGRMKSCVNPGFFQSVHLGGDGLAKEKADTKLKEEEIWKSKVVVDNTDFLVGSFSVRDRPLQVDRAKEILQSPIKKTAFRMVRNARLPSGRRALLRPAPVSAFASEPFVDHKDFTVDLRGDDPELFVGTDPETGNRVDFETHLHRDRMKKKSHIICSRRKHPPIYEHEKLGPRWE
ncbi:unnamed protein product, partial [Choristocarpus tenellus]